MGTHTHTATTNQTKQNTAKKRFLPRRLQIVGYARTAMSADDLRARLRPYLKGGAPEAVERFLSHCSYLHGDYAPDSPGFGALEAACGAWEAQPLHPAGRLFYLALPPNVYPDVSLFVCFLGVFFWGVALFALVCAFVFSRCACVVMAAAAKGVCCVVLCDDAGRA